MWWKEYVSATDLFFGRMLFNASLLWSNEIPRFHLTPKRHNQTSPAMTMPSQRSDRRLLRRLLNHWAKYTSRFTTNRFYSTRIYPTWPPSAFFFLQCQVLSCSNLLHLLPYNITISLPTIHLLPSFRTHFGAFAGAFEKAIGLHIFENTPLKTNITLEKSPCSIGNTSSFMVDFPASHL